MASPHPEALLDGGRGSRRLGAPSWTADAVAYQIFVDRFARGPVVGCPGAARWRDRPDAPRAIVGGDLRGIRDRLDDLNRLGVDLLCLTPIFLAASYHRYDTHDYHRIDPRLGTLDDLRDLVAAAHRRGMRILLDGVFNHCGRGFFPFVDVMENGADSAFGDWFHITGFPVDAYGAARYRCWFDTPSLPEFDLAHPDARAHLLDAARYWTAQGIDGWRLDAVPHVEHRPFWREFRRVVLAVNPDAYLVGEIWGDPTPWLVTGDLDGATNYPLRERILDFVVRRSLRPSRLAGELARLAARNPATVMLNPLGSHDTPRLATLARGDAERVRLALLLLFFFPGVPALYYGDEVGMEGGQDPDNRRLMTWDPEPTGEGLRRFVGRLVRARRALAPLRRGDWRTLFTDDSHGVAAFARRWRDEEAMLVVNAGPSPVSLVADLERAPATVLDPLAATELPVKDGALRLDELPAGSGRLLAARGRLEFRRSAIATLRPAAEPARR